MKALPESIRHPLTALVGYINDGRFFNVVFLAMLAMTIAIISIDLGEMVASAPDGIPGSQQIEPELMPLPQPGDQKRTYLPKSMPLGPNRQTPRLPGIVGPIDPMVMGEAMQFYRGTDGDYSAVGTITPGTAERWKRFLADNDKQIGRLFLHSPGGSVSDALEISRSVRLAGISTVVPARGYCASSCPLVLAGGLYRSTGAQSWVGVHQIYKVGAAALGTLQQGMEDAQHVSADCQKHLYEMGVDPRLWTFAMDTPPADLYLLTERQIRTLKLANSSRPTTIPSLRPLPSG